MPASPTAGTTGSSTASTTASEDKNVSEPGLIHNKITATSER